MTPSFTLQVLHPSNQEVQLGGGVTRGLGVEGMIVGLGLELQRSSILHIAPGGQVQEMGELVGAGVNPDGQTVMGSHGAWAHWTSF